MNAITGKRKPQADLILPACKESKIVKRMAWFSIERDGIEMLKQAVLSGAKLDYVDPKGRTLLHRAVFLRSTKAIQYLINEHKIDPNVRDNKGLTPLWYAAQQCSSPGDVAVLLNAGAKLYASKKRVCVDFYNRFLFDSAIYSACDELIADMISLRMHESGWSGNYRYSWFESAFEYKKFKYVKWLDPELRSLGLIKHAAIKKDQVPALRDILNGQEMRFDDSDLFTVIGHQARDSLKYLIEEVQILRDLPGVNENSLLESAIFQNSYQCIAYLLARVKPVQYSLQMLVNKNWIYALECYLKEINQIVDFNAYTNHKGETLLCFALLGGDPYMMKKLVVEHDISLHMTDEAGRKKSIFEYAKEVKKEHVLFEFLEVMTRYGSEDDLKVYKEKILPIVPKNFHLINEEASLKSVRPSGRDLDKTQMICKEIFERGSIEDINECANWNCDLSKIVIGVYDDRLKCLEHILANQLLNPNQIDIGEWSSLAIKGCIRHYSNPNQQHLDREALAYLAASGKLKLPCGEIYVDIDECLLYGMQFGQAKTVDEIRKKSSITEKEIFHCALNHASDAFIAKIYNFKNLTTWHLTQSVDFKRYKVADKILREGKITPVEVGSYVDQSGLAERLFSKKAKNSIGDEYEAFFSQIEAHDILSLINSLYSFTSTPLKFKSNCMRYFLVIALQKLDYFLVEELIETYRCNLIDNWDPHGYEEDRNHGLVGPIPLAMIPFVARNPALLWMDSYKLKAYLLWVLKKQQPDELKQPEDYLTYQNHLEEILKVLQSNFTREVEEFLNRFLAYFPDLKYEKEDRAARIESGKKWIQIDWVRRAKYELD